MNRNLFTTFHVDKNPMRDNELRYCLEQNLKVFNRIILLIDNGSMYDEVYDSASEIYSRLKRRGEAFCDNAIAEHFDRRPLFNDFLSLMDSSDYANDLNIIANADIIFPDLDSIQSASAPIESIDFPHDNEASKVCLALSRWDLMPDGRTMHYDHLDSQDAWVFKGNPNMKTSIDIRIGEAGCDNRFAWELEQNGYRVLNPSKTVKILHLHNSGVRNYIGENGKPMATVPPPYSMVQPY